MTRRERVIAALNHQETDFVPYHIDFTGQEYEAVARYLGDSRFIESWGCHMHGGNFSGWPEEIEGRPGFFRDTFGVVWNRTGADRDIGVIESAVIPDIEDNRYCFPELDEGRIRAEIERAIAVQEDRFTCYGVGFSMFERAWTLCTMPGVLMAMVAAPDALHALLDDICAFDMRVVDIACEYKELDGIYFGDDWGQQKGLIMGPAHWRTFVKPRMARLYARAKSAGKYVLQHSCGDIHELFPDLIEIGLDAYQTFQPEIYDVESMKRQFGDRLAFWGGISTQRLLPFATPAEVEAETRRLMAIIGRGGGYIAGPTHSIPGDVPPENVLAMVRAFRKQGK